MLDQLVRHHLRDVLGQEPLLVQADIASGLDRLDDRRVRRGPTDAELLEGLDERRLRVPGWRLCEVLLGQQLEHPQHLLRGELGQARLGVLVGPLVSSLGVDPDEPVEHERLSGRPQAVVRVPVGGSDVYADLREASLGHLRRHGALPDQVVQAELIAIERGGDPVGGTEDRRGANGFVGLLGVARPRLVAPMLGQRVRRAVLLLHELRDLAEGRVGDRHRVGPHVGDQSHRPLARKRYALVQALRERHRLARREPQLPRRLLLQGGGGERRGRRPLALLPLDVDDTVGGPAESLHVRHRVGLGAEEDALLVRRGREFALGDLRQPRDERLLLTLRCESDIDAPVLDRDEGADLALALDDQANGDRLDPARGQPGPHLPPQDRADPVADETIEDPARFLCIDELQVDRARVPHRLEDRVPRDLRERDPLRLVGRDAEQGGHVVGDRLALAVVVRCEHELVRAFERPLQVRDVPLGVFGDLVDRFEPVLHVDAELALR